MKQIKKNKVHPVIKWLREEQDKLQARFKKRICKLKVKNYEYRGVWISSTCFCGYESTAPYNISDNGKCRNCHKFVFRGRK